MEYLQDSSKRIQRQFYLSVGSLTIKVCTLNDATLVRLDSSSVCMTETILRYMFEFYGCIDVTFELARRYDRCQVYAIL